MHKNILHPPPPKKKKWICGAWFECHPILPWNPEFTLFSVRRTKISLWNNFEMILVLKSNRKPLRKRGNQMIFQGGWMFFSFPYGFCVTRDGPKICRMTRDWTQIICVTRDRTSQRDVWFAILQVSDARFTISNC